MVQSCEIFILPDQMSMKLLPNHVNYINCVADRSVSFDELDVKMAYYTNSDKIRELMTSMADVDVKSMDNSFELTGLTLYIFDDLFRDRELSSYRVGRDKNAVTFKSLWEKRPEWGGMILELMKNNQPVHLCVGGIDVWYRMLIYMCFEGEDFFQFIREKPPVLNAHRNCLISTAEFLHREMEYAITDLMEPMRTKMNCVRNGRKVCVKRFTTMEMSLKP